MKISLFVIGKTDSAYLKEGIEEYCKRLKHYVPFDFITVPNLKQTKNLPVEVQKRKKGKLYWEKLTKGQQLYCLTRRGKTMNSRDFSGFIEQRTIAGTKELVFVIGGAFGFSDELYGIAAGKISLSKMTFSHQMVRLLFLEQLYRAFTIIKGEPYHND